MPVNRGRLGHSVLYSDDHALPSLSAERRSRELPIDDWNGLWHTVGAHGLFLNDPGLHDRFKPLIRILLLAMPRLLPNTTHMLFASPIAPLWLLLPSIEAAVLLSKWDIDCRRSIMSVSIRFFDICSVVVLTSASQIMSVAVAMTISRALFTPLLLIRK